MSRAPYVSWRDFLGIGISIFSLYRLATFLAPPQPNPPRIHTYAHVCVRVGMSVGAQSNAPISIASLPGHSLPRSSCYMYTPLIYLTWRETKISLGGNALGASPEDDKDNDNALDLD